MAIKFLYDRNKDAVYFNERAYSYKTLIKYVKYFSSILNIQKDDRVAILLENRPETVFTLFSIWDKKGISINLDAAYDVEQLAYVFNDSNPKYIFTSDKTYTVAKNAKEKTNSEIIIINVDEIEEEKIKNFIPETEELYIENEDDVAIILYTSGTTGNPKGVMLTYENIMANINGVTNVNLVTDKDTILAILPYHHILPLSFTLIMPIYFGVPIVILGEISSVKLKETLKKYKITVIVGVPRVWEMLHKNIMGQIEKNSLAKFMFNLAKKINSFSIRKKIFSKVHSELGGALRILVSGGAKLDSNIIDDFLTLGFHLIQGYGMTETAPIISFNVPGREKTDTVGEIIPNVEVKFSEDNEILVKGKNVMKGYYNNSIATKESFDSEGWFRTGDLGEMADNHLKIIGRKKEMIVLPNGKNINPSDIEIEIMKQTNLIKEIAVTEYKDHLLALIYPDFELIQEKKIVNIKEAIKWEVIDKYNISAPNYKKIHDIKIVKNELPKTRMGKIRRFMLKDLIENENISKQDKKEKKDFVVPEEIKTEFNILKDYVQKEYKLDIAPDSHIELDLNFDSLDIVELMNFLNSNLNINLVEEDFIENKSIAAISKMIKLKREDANKKNENLKKIIEQPSNLKLPNSSIVSKILNIIFWPIFKLYFNLEIKNKEKIQNGAGIIVANHQSFLDAFMINQAFSGRELKDNYYIATVIHFKGKFKKFAADNGNIILVDINKNLKNTLQAASQVLKNGKKLIIFPEGARTRDGKLQDFKKTFAILAKELNVPIYPAVIKGAYESLPYGVKFPKKTKLTLEFLDKIETNAKNIDEIISEVKANISKTLN